MWLIELVFPQFCKSDMSKYGSRSISESPLELEVTGVVIVAYGEIKL